MSHLPPPPKPPHQFHFLPSRPSHRPPTRDLPTVPRGLRSRLLVQDRQCRPIGASPPPGNCPPRKTAPPPSSALTDLSSPVNVLERWMVVDADGARWPAPHRWPPCPFPSKVAGNRPDNKLLPGFGLEVGPPGQALCRTSTWPATGWRPEACPRQMRGWPCYRGLPTAGVPPPPGLPRRPCAGCGGGRGMGSCPPPAISLCWRSFGPAHPLSSRAGATPQPRAETPNSQRSVGRPPLLNSDLSDGVKSQVTRVPDCALSDAPPTHPHTHCHLTHTPVM